MLAQQARTVQAISKGRLVLGIGLSHQVVVEGMWGYGFESPATYMREYLDALVPMLRGEQVSVRGERVTAVTIGPVGPEWPTPPKLVLAALGPAMLKLAATMADGTVTWMTGLATLRDYIVPTITAAAAEAGRPAPSVMASLPVCCTTDAAGAIERINKALAIYPTLPSYKAMLDREGATAAGDVALVGSKDQIVDTMDQLAAAGVTDLGAAVMGTPDEQAATVALLSEYARR
jgi:F420-dependent oxidoreductase-like protein